MKDDDQKQLRRLTAQIIDLFGVESTYQSQNRTTLCLSYRYDPVKSRKMLKDRLDLSGYDYTLHESENSLLLETNLNPKLKIPRINIILFFTTIASVYFMPVFLLNGGFGGLPIAEAFQATITELGQGKNIIFTIALISILLVHEMGHFVAGRRRGIVTSWPYFIPAPSIIGTFGALIKSKSPFWNRRDLIEVGAAGPIAGWIIAIIWLVYGLTDSYLLLPGMPVPTTLVFSLEGESILIKLLVPLFIGESAMTGAYILSEAAFAGWVGLLITAINLLPMGQLDGGHITYGLVRTKQHLLGWFTVGVLLILGINSPMWWLFAGISLFMGLKHPPTIEDHRRPSRAAIIMGILSWLIFILSFTPVPFRVG